ncbi:MAG: carotenoid oxygenase [Sphingomonas bacterium]|nr:carotenoid oxygenase family protein [Sphingomonas bacterium]MDB5688871.1 carotenoid oxygenase [Sphingomonas bacterium]
MAARAFPPSLHYQGLNAPVRMEIDIRDLPVEGEIPAEIAGAFFRAVPDPAHPPMLGEDDNVLSGDGMVGRFLIEDGHVDYTTRYVRTERFEAERKARRSLFGKYRNPFTDDPSVAGVDRTVANTTPIWHAGRLYMTKEDGRAYRVDPITLETIGRWDWNGALKSETMTAHARIDPETNEMFAYGYEAAGLASRQIAYFIVGPDGELQSEQWFEAPYAAMVHDFAITEKFAIFPLFPTTADLDRLKAGGAHWVHQQDAPSWIGIMPRYGKVDEMVWIEGPAGVHAYHFMNAFDDNGAIQIDVCLSDTNAFPFIRSASGIDRHQSTVRSSLSRWTIDLEAKAITERVVGPPGDLPMIERKDQARPYGHGWYITYDPNQGPPIPAGPVETACNTLFRIEPGNGRLEALGLGPTRAINEPVHVPSSDPGHGGWLLAVVDERAGDGFKSALWVIEASDIAKGPIATVPVPVPMRPQVHGWWVPQAELEAAARA